MTSSLLFIGCTLLAFSPVLSLLLLITYSKAQLVIIVTTSAFFQLIACLLASILHLPFRLTDFGSSNAIVLIPTSIFAQAVCRCAFVHMYHKVEAVIEKSILKHEEENGGDDADVDADVNDNNSPESDTQIELSERSRLRLELNDVTCGLAAGIGFGGMHTVMLYGTLLASEGGNMGTLYQSSCSFMPSLVNSGIMAFCFSLLDICWMMACFYGMRRLQNGNQEEAWVFKRGAVGGKAALAFIVASHLAAALSTTPNQFPSVQNGCVVALPLLAFITVASIVSFYVYCNESYLPEGQKSRIHGSSAANEHLD